MEHLSLKEETIFAALKGSVCVAFCEVRADGMHAGTRTQKWR